MKVIGLALVTIVVSLSSMSAQAALPKSVGKLDGVVVDPNNARIVKASVKIEGRRIRREILSDGEGRFEIELPAGSYRITVYSPGFGQFRHKSVKVRADTTTTINISLKVAAVGPCPSAKDRGDMVCM